MSFELAVCDQPLDATGKTKLIKCCEEINVNGVRSLLTQNANPDLTNKDGQTPLYVACKTGAAEIVSMLLYARANVSKANSAGFSPLYIASQKGHLDCCQTLLNAKADVNQGARNRATPLFIASEVGHARIVKTLLRANAAVDTQKSDDSTALIAASYFGRCDIVELLLDAGAKLDLRDGDGTAFDNAFKQRQDGVMALLKEAEKARRALAMHGLLGGDSDVEDEVEAHREDDGGIADEVEEDDVVHGGALHDDDGGIEDEVGEDFGSPVHSPPPVMNTLPVATAPVRDTRARPQSAGRRPPRECAVAGDGGAVSQQGWGARPRRQLAIGDGCLPRPSQRRLMRSLRRSRRPRRRRSTTEPSSRSISSRRLRR